MTLGQKTERLATVTVIIILTKARLILFGHITEIVTFTLIMSPPNHEITAARDKAASPLFMQDSSVY